ncbi:hypothetical protein M9978_20230 [Sphingomonas sp. MG17]|uniref:Uncharacterized protein n=1 Tax=Sphingomonas tagetis TaxID=2949092 RepID=A0A9X2HVH3_9SPHN|nr:hypothetical protein [Sphingomonas tagetis]MCP3732750.1 hypothetical protein [Sphingomonas tagetis]
MVFLGATPQAAGQSVEDRARSAAAAARAKSGDSEALQRNYVTPGLAGQPVSTIDGRQSFNPSLACQKTATLLEVLAQPGATGDLMSVQIARDTDLDGKIDSRATLPAPVSGICANGVISCQPGSWSQCKHFRWNVDGTGQLKLSEAALDELAGCYCINNSCGANLAWGNLASVLRDLGGGMIGALTTADPRFGIAQAVTDGPLIRYTGAQTTACAASPQLPQTAYRANPVTIAGDAQATAASSSLFETLTGSPAGLGKAIQQRRCTIERQVEVRQPGIEDIVERVSGGYSVTITGKTLDLAMGSPGENSLRGGNCGLIDFRMTLRVDAPDRIVAARLLDYYADDWAQLRIDGQLIASGPGGWSSLGLPPAKCERSDRFSASPNLDIKSYLTKGEHEIWLRVAVADKGEARARFQIQVNDSCQSSEQLVDHCAAIAQDKKCRIDSETVDGVQTFRNGVNTGLRPLPQTRQFGTSSCPIELKRDFFLRERSYRCEIDSTALPAPDLSRGAYILDRSTETLLADRMRTTTGGATETIRPFSLPDRGAVPACEPICKTRAPKVNTATAPQGVIGSQQNDPSSFDTYYHSCGTDNVCPVGPGEELISACGCLDDFPEAVVMMQTVRLAGADLLCTTSPQ